MARRITLGFSSYSTEIHGQAEQLAVNGVNKEGGGTKTITLIITWFFNCVLKVKIVSVRISFFFNCNLLFGTKRVKTSVIQRARLPLPDAGGDCCGCTRVAR